MDDSKIASITKRWVQEVVVAHQLCPFAEHVLLQDKVKFIVSSAADETNLLVDLQQALQELLLVQAFETTLLIHPQVMTDFADYNHFLGSAEELLELLDADGELQIASFHPDYQFADTQPQAAENFTNRSPFPMLHILRESSVTKAVESYPAIDDIPERNIKTMQGLGSECLAGKLVEIRNSN
jgi:hypothetical protein